MNRSSLSSEQLILQDIHIVCGAYEDYMLLLNCSTHTIAAYLCNFRKYYQWCQANNVDEIYEQNQVRSYLLYRVRNGAKWQTMNNIYSAMRKLFGEVLELDWSFKKLPRPKKERVLPELIPNKRSND